MDSRETGVEAYHRIERDISREEQAAPAPSLGHEMAKLDRFIADIENLMSQLSQERIAAEVETSSNDRFSQKYFNPRYGRKKPKRTQDGDSRRLWRLYARTIDRQNLFLCFYYFLQFFISLHNTVVRVLRGLLTVTMV